MVGQCSPGAGFGERHGNAIIQMSALVLLLEAPSGDIAWLLLRCLLLRCVWTLAASCADWMWGHVG